jgi:hypothetical protein
MNSTRSALRPTICFLITSALLVAGCSGAGDEIVPSPLPSTTPVFKFPADETLFKKYGYATPDESITKGGFIDYDDAREILAKGFSTRATYESSVLERVKSVYESNGRITLYGTDSCRQARFELKKAAARHDVRWVEAWETDLHSYCSAGAYVTDGSYQVLYLPSILQGCRHRPASQPDHAYLENYDYRAMRTYFNLLGALAPRDGFYGNLDKDLVHQRLLEAEDGGCPGGTATREFKQSSLLDQPQKKTLALEQFESTSKSISGQPETAYHQQLIALASDARIEISEPWMVDGEYRFRLRMQTVIHQGHLGRAMYSDYQCRYTFENLPENDYFEFKTKSESTARKLEKIIRKEPTTQSLIRRIDLQQYQGIFYDEKKVRVTLYAIVSGLEQTSCAVLLKAQAMEVAEINPQDPIYGKPTKIDVEMLTE